MCVMCTYALHSFRPQNNSIYIYDVEGDALMQRQVLETSKPCTELAISPDGAWLAAGSTERNMIVFNISDGYKVRRL